MKKRNTLILVLILLVVVILFCAFCDRKRKKQNSFMQHPPVATQFWVQQLRKPLSSGENLIFSVQYESDSLLPEKIDIYKNGKVSLTLRDDGKAPDKVKGDKKYAAYLKEDISGFVAQIETAEAVLRRKGEFLEFTGHSGKVVLFDRIVKFNKSAFMNFTETEVSKSLLNAVDCNSSLLKEKSLFITDLFVVEDQSRTYNAFTGVGNPNGVWTFGALMSNIENNTHADGIRGFLKDWVKQWVTVQNVNGYTVKTRDFAMETMIEPWLRKANNNPTLVVNLSNWENIWNATPANNIKINAPFKLTAIVNRIDLRANMAYTASVTNSGETRFIFTLTNPLIGKIPINPNQTGAQQEHGNKSGFVDWRGLNVIFEYGNPQTTNCQLQNFAQQWYDLSDPIYTFGTPNINNPYKDALQAITDQVTAINAIPSKVNGSAIHRIRTNEKVFATFFYNQTSSNPDVPKNSEEAWEKQDWEFRQFEINPMSHKLVMVPLTNNPDHTANHSENIQEDYTTSSHPVNNQDILNWIFSGHRLQAQSGNFNLANNLLSGSGIVRREQTQYSDFIRDNFISAGGYVDNTSPEAKQIRHQLSLNTCAGCHAGETKTVFTHINPLAYGEGAKYWHTVLDGATDISQDEALYPWGGSDALKIGGKNKGYTEGSGGGLNFDTQKEIHPRRFFQILSPFLTGRRLFSNILNDWEDDEPNNNNEAPYFDKSDNSLDWLFFVNDPSNNGYFPYIDDQKWGYNDLERRKKDLCLFLNTNCSGFTINGTTELMQLISFTPFPLASH